MTTYYEWWIDPPKSNNAGWLNYKTHDEEVDEYHNENTYHIVGFQCQRQNYMPLMSDKYECWSYHSYVKFKVPTATSGVLDSALLYLCIGGADNLMNVNPIYMDVDVYYKTGYQDATFPWSQVSINDYPDIFGTWTQNPYSFEDMYEMWGDFKTDGPHWLTPIDVTAGVQKAIDEGWTWAAFMLTPNYPTPLDWDYDTRPVNFDQKMWVGFYGACDSQWIAAPTGFPPGTYISTSPWLRITYSGGDSQYVPGEDVTTSGQGATISCIAADPKLQAAIIGTTNGSIWVTISGGTKWRKLFEQDEPITAVWMDSIRNLQDYPDGSYAWFGTASGTLYRSTDSLGNWQPIHYFSYPIVEIMSSDIDSKRVVVGTREEVWRTADGGDSWTLCKSRPLF